ncbi:uncharacterized protein [Henckelia pumila]|uniref:uncharacterized protein n=1 Tax=Henckelia pumila TaxID=405737 RepID=UPI003C6DC7C9
MGHSTEMCPTLQEETVEQVNETGGFPRPPQRNYDPYSNTYNPGWRDHPNLRYGNTAVNHTPPQVQPNNQAYKPPYPPPPQRPQIPTPGEFLENIVKNLANTLNFQQKMRASIQNLNTQVGQLATAINKLEAQHSNILPSQTVPNPKENVSPITLRSGKELKVREEVVQAPVKNEYEEKSKVEEDEIVQKNTSKDVRKQKLNGCQKIELGEQVSAVIQRKIPVKCKDSGMFSIPCKIGDVQLDTAMLDLGASINVISYSTYASLKLGPLNETAIVIQMADRSTIYPRGVIEDVLIKVGNLVFLADFYVLDMKNNDLNIPIFLGRPFLITSKSIIDVNNGTLTMEFYGEIVKFNIFDTLTIFNCERVVNTLDINDHLSQENKKLMNEDKMKKIVERSVENSNAKIFLSDLQASKTKPKLPPDRAKGIPMGKGRNHPEMGI